MFSSAFSFFLLLLLFWLCSPSFEVEIHSKRGWVQIGQCLLECSENRPHCLQMCPSKVKMDPTFKYNGRILRERWIFHEDCEILTDNKDGLTVIKYHAPYMVDSATEVSQSSESLVFMALFEANENDLWHLGGWNRSLVIKTKLQDTRNVILLAVCDRGLLAERRCFHGDDDVIPDDNKKGHASQIAILILFIMIPVCLVLLIAYVCRSRPFRRKLAYELVRMSRFKTDVV